LSAADNVAMPLVLADRPRSEVALRVDEMLDLVGMRGRASHRPHELSGGEQQRVAIARALIAKPPIVLADEPTGNLDRATGETIMTLLQDINEQMGVTILMVTHDAGHAACSQRVLRLVDGRLDQEVALAPGDY
jgi:ABC-type lipoprotein export system ATPase subunit